MTKLFLIILSIPALIIFLNAVHAINSMSICTKELFRWSYILIALGAGIEIAALLAVYSINYGTWCGIKMMVSGAIMMNFGYAGLYFADRRRRKDNGH